MLSEERVILMTRMEIYENHEGSRDRKIGHFFRGDYISMQLLKSFFSASIAYLIVFALYIVYHFEELMAGIYEMDILAFVRQVLTSYVWTVVIYCVITYAVYTYRYSRAKKSLKEFYQNLKKLNSLYDNE